MTTKKQQPTKTEKSVSEQLIEKHFSNLPIVQTRHLTQLFGFNDGGKYLRRHLRKHFQNEHLWGDSWVWKPTDKQLIEIVEYFTDTVNVFDETKRATVSSLNPHHDLTKLEIK